ncbi:MAG: hypothetical protein KKC75_04765 [Nanoarchaeota archaeon]|nr:hypothetical protein [Nanoarchaeota archaeon]MBU1004457.1 hypothetical protein [Nanoarchaeota archaeon]MBU1946793.1 hypothetical protein [Nanoarchaeota archaeon]
MGKAKIRKKVEGYEEQLKKHITKFNEAKERDDIGSMNYMAREMSDYLKRMDILKKRLLPKKFRKKLNKI